MKLKPLELERESDDFEKKSISVQYASPYLIMNVALKPDPAAAIPTFL